MADDDAAVADENEDAQATDAGEADSPAVAVDDAPVNDDTNQDTVPEFEPLKPNPPKAGGNVDLSRFSGVHVTLAAELGRTDLTIQELIGLAEGSVIELNRAISAPVELIAQGVPMGNGEVVVVDDQFAIRIKEIYPS